MSKFSLLLMLGFLLPALAWAEAGHLEFAKDTIKGEAVKEYMVPMSGSLFIDMYPTRVVRPMGITITYLRSDDGKQWNTYRTEQMEAGAMEKSYKTKIECNKCKVRVSVKLLSLFEFRMTATTIKQ